MKILSLFIMLLLSLPVEAQLISEWPSELYDRLRTDLHSEIDEAGADLQQSLFESLTDISLIETSFGDLSLSLDVQRRVFKNYDLLNSYTVIDFMRLPLEWPLPLGNQVAVGASAFQLQLGLTLTPEIYNIRQVLPKGFGPAPG